MILKGIERQNLYYGMIRKMQLKVNFTKTNRLKKKFVCDKKCIFDEPFYLLLLARKSLRLFSSVQTNRREIKGPPV